MSESDKLGKPELKAKRTAAEIVGSALSRKIDEVEALKARIAELEAEVKVQYAKGWNDAISSAIETAHAFSSGCAAMEIEQQLQKKRIKRKKP